VSDLGAPAFRRPLFASESARAVSQGRLLTPILDRTQPHLADLLSPTQQLLQPNQEICAPLT